MDLNEIPLRAAHYARPLDELFVIFQHGSLTLTIEECWQEGWKARRIGGEMHTNRVQKLHTGVFFCTPSLSLSLSLSVVLLSPSVFA